MSSVDVASRNFDDNNFNVGAGHVTSHILHLTNQYIEYLTNTENQSINKFSDHLLLHIFFEFVIRSDAKIVFEAER